MLFLSYLIFWGALCGFDGIFGFNFFNVPLDAANAANVVHENFLLKNENQMLNMKIIEMEGEYNLFINGLENEILHQKSECARIKEQKNFYFEAFEEKKGTALQLKEMLRIAYVDKDELSTITDYMNYHISYNDFYQEYSSSDSNDDDNYYYDDNYSNSNYSNSNDDNYSNSNDDNYSNNK